MTEKFQIQIKRRNEIIDLFYLREKHKKVLLMLCILFLFTLIYEYKTKYMTDMPSEDKSKMLLSSGIKNKNKELLTNAHQLAVKFYNNLDESIYKDELQRILGTIINICNQIATQTTNNLNNKEKLIQTTLQAIDKLYIFVNLPYIEKNKQIQSLQFELLKFYKSYNLTKPLLVEFLPDLVVRKEEKEIKEPLRDIFSYKN